jgi:hypothetical protein
MTATLGYYRILDLYHEQRAVVEKTTIKEAVAALERLDPYPIKNPRYVIAKALQ